MEEHRRGEQLNRATEAHLGRERGTEGESEGGKTRLGREGGEGPKFMQVISSSPSPAVRGDRQTQPRGQ